MSDGREIKGEAMRARLRASAESLIAEIGIEAATTVEIARRCGVSRGAMLHHYPRRTDIIIDTARHFWNRARTISSCLADDMSAGRLDMPAFVSRLYDDVFPEQSLLTMLELMVAGRSDTELGRAVNEILGDLFRFYEVFCETAFASREAAPDQIRVIVTLIVSTLRGLRLQQIADRRHTDVDAVKASLVSAVEHLLATGARQTRLPARKERA